MIKYKMFVPETELEAQFNDRNNAIHEIKRLMNTLKKENSGKKLHK